MKRYQSLRTLKIMLKTNKGIITKPSNFFRVTRNHEEFWVYKQLTACRKAGIRVNNGCNDTIVYMPNLI